MKKLFLVFAFFGLFTFLTPKIADAAEADCVTAIITCCDGTQHYAVLCGSPYGQALDYFMWIGLLCAPCT